VVSGRAAQPGDHGAGHRGRVAAQVVALAGQDMDVDPGPAGRYAERVPVAVDDQRRHPGRQLAGAGPLRLAGRVQREGQRHHSCRAELAGGAAGHPGPARPAADNQRHLGHPLGRGAHRGTPRLVQRWGGRRCPPPGNPVRLGDQGHGDAGRQRGCAHRDQIG
jgi:hypothetical protein